MRLRQFAKSLVMIYRSENANRPAALMRHLFWQTKRFGARAPISVRLSRSILMDDAAGGVISEVNMLGLYNFNNMKLVQMLLCDGGDFIDVGANIGAYTLIASENAEARVVSIEPNPTAFRMLERNVNRNARANVIAINIAASKRPGVVRMTDKGSDPTNRIVSGESEGPMIEVTADTIDAICALHGIVPRLIKIDVEGHEREVLEGAARHIGGALACIVEDGDRREVTEIMSNYFMRGPFYYNHRLAYLSRQAQRLREDSVYINRRFEDEYPHVRIDKPGDKLKTGHS